MLPKEGSNLQQVSYCSMHCPCTAHVMCVYSNVIVENLVLYWIHTYHHLCQQGHSAEVICVHFNSVGDMLITGSFDNTVSVWDPASGRRLHTLIGHRAEISSAEFSYDGSIIATGSMDKTCKLWDCTTGKCISTLRLV